MREGNLKAFIIWWLKGKNKLTNCHWMSKAQALSLRCAQTAPGGRRNKWGWVSCLCSPGLGLKGRMVQMEAITSQASESIVIKSSRGKKGCSVLSWEEDWQEAADLGDVFLSWTSCRELGFSYVKGGRKNMLLICRGISKLLWFMHL